jgi:hypothetical protein
MLFDQYGNPLRQSPGGYFEINDQKTAEVWEKALAAEVGHKGFLLSGPALVDPHGKRVHSASGKEIRVQSVFAKRITIASPETDAPIMILDDKET